jgi:NitT/TauT family transport system substrate-binding protein
MKRTGALALAAAMFAAAAQPGWADPVRIGFAVPDDVNVSPAYAARQLGYYKEAKLDVELTNFRGGAAAQEALSAGAIDIITYFAPGVGLAVSKGAKEKMVATATADSVGWHILVGAKSPYQSMKDLDGKKVGISVKASTSDMFALWAADQAGVKIQTIPLGGGGLLPGLKAGQVDAIVFSAVVSLRALTSGDARSILDLGKTMIPTISDVYVASQEMLDKRPQELRATLAAIYRALHYMRENRAWTVAFLKTYAKTDSDQIAGTLFDQVINGISSDGTIEQKWVEDSLHLAARAWDMPELAKVPAAPLFTNEFHPHAK